MPFSFHGTQCNQSPVPNFSATRCFGRPDPARRKPVQTRERRNHAVDDLNAREARVAAQRIDSFVRARGALVAQLLTTDPEHLDHSIAVRVVAHGDVVKHRAADETLLRCATNFALGAYDVVQCLIKGVDPKRSERRDDPFVEEGIRVCEAHALYEIRRRVDRVGDHGVRARRQGVRSSPRLERPGSRACVAAPPCDRVRYCRSSLDANGAARPLSDFHIYTHTTSPIKVTTASPI